VISADFDLSVAVSPAGPHIVPVESAAIAPIVNGIAAAIRIEDLE
jgi:hypothetical protein